MQAPFQRTNKGLEPTTTALSPWADDRLHGGPVLGAMTQAAIDHVGDAGLRLTRLTGDLSGGIPNAPLQMVVEPLREGRRIHLLQVSVLAGGSEVARGSALFLKPGEGTFQILDNSVPTGPQGVETEPLIRGKRAETMRPGFHLTVETRRPERQAGQPKAMWFRMPMSLIEGVPLNPTVGAIALSDFNNSVASIMAYEDGRATAHINVDTTMYLERPPVGEWTCLVADHQSDTEAISVSEVAHHDVRGRFGRSTQARLENRFE